MGYWFRISFNMFDRLRGADRDLVDEVKRCYSDSVARDSILLVRVPGGSEYYVYTQEEPLYWLPLLRNNARRSEVPFAPLEYVFGNKYKFLLQFESLQALA